MRGSILSISMVALVGCLPDGGGEGSADGGGFVFDGGARLDRGAPSMDAVVPSTGDAAPDGGPVGLDARPPRPDGAPPRDQGPTPDRGVTPRDAGPPPDGAPPRLDAAPRPDLGPVECLPPDGCVTSIYAARRDLPAETLVTVQGVVTAVRGTSHIVLQVPIGHDHFSGHDYSGIWVYLNDAEPPVDIPARGDFVHVTGLTNDRFGQRQLYALTALRQGEPWPATPPRVIEVAEITTGGPRAASLEGVLVQVEDVDVSDPAPPPGVGDADDPMEFEIVGGLRVDDFLYAVPQPARGAHFDRITGVLRFSNDLSKIEPRDADDLDGAPPPPRAEGLVVNEVDYDQSGVDMREFVEVLNASDGPLSLEGVVLELVDGNDGEPYATYALDEAAAELPSGGYLVVGAEIVQPLLPAGVPFLATTRATNALQNGPDGVRLLAADGSTLDSMAYGAQVLDGVTEGGVNAPDDRVPNENAALSVSRCPDGVDRDINGEDFQTVDRSPGAPNTCN